MRKRLLQVGQRFGQQTLLEKLPGYPPQWKVRCICGNEHTVYQYNLTKKTSPVRMCAACSHSPVHGKCEARIYRIWSNMRQRCTNPNSSSYKNYGERGITVCVAWADFETFLRDMGEPPTPKHKLERRNNDGNYTPENCCWATNAEQQRNTRQNHHHLTARGETLLLVDWAERLGVSSAHILWHLQRGRTMEQIVDFPFKSRTQFVTVHGETRSLREWSQYLTISTTTLWRYMKKGYTMEQIVSHFSPQGLITP